MTDLESVIQEMNKYPPNKAAAEAQFRLIGERPLKDEWFLLSLLEAKLQLEELEPPDPLATDVYDFKEALTPEWVRKTTVYLTEEGMDAEELMEMDAEGLMTWITDAIPMDEFYPMRWLLTRD